jgi:hypothetical protein
LQLRERTFEALWRSIVWQFRHQAVLFSQEVSSGHAIV